MPHRRHDPNHEEPRASRPGDKPYESPRLTEWGTLVDLTHGPTTGFEDFPAQGGTQGV